MSEGEYVGISDIGSCVEVADGEYVGMAEVGL